LIDFGFREVKVFSLNPQSDGLYDAEMNRSFGVPISLIVFSILSLGWTNQGFSKKIDGPQEEVPPKELESPLEPDSSKVSESLMDQGKAVGSKALEALRASKENREVRKHSVLGTYSLIDTWIPSKIGASYVFHPTSSGGWEVEYLRGSLSIPFFIEDLGQITDQRISIFYRSYSQRNSFSFHYGINYSSLKATLGNSYLTTISAGSVSKYELLTIQTLGFNWGLGNRWQFKNRVTIGLDWFSIYIPIKILESNADFLQASASEAKKNEIRDALDVIEKVPTFALLKLQLGISF